jgi:hypothetical protein
VDGVGQSWLVSSDELPLERGHRIKVLRHASPTVIQARLVQAGRRCQESLDLYRSLPQGDRGYFCKPILGLVRLHSARSDGESGLVGRQPSRYSDQVEFLILKGASALRIFQKAYSVVGALLMLEFFAQLYFMAATIFTIVNTNDNAKDVYAAFKNADTFAGLHAINGYIVGLTILIMLILSFAARHPWRTTILTGVLFLLLVLQIVFARIPVPAVAALHGLNALILIGLGGYLTGTTWAFGRRAEVSAR